MKLSKLGKRKKGNRSLIEIYFILFHPVNHLKIPPMYLATCADPLVRTLKLFCRIHKFCLFLR